MNLLSTTERAGILKDIIFRSSIPGVSHLAKELRLSKGMVSAYLSSLGRQGVLKKSGRNYLVLDTPVTKALRIFFNVSAFRPVFFRRFGFIRAAGLYGSAARGENTTESDIDVWIKIRPQPDSQLARLTTALSKQINNIKILLLDDKKIARLKRDDLNFYHSIVFGSIILYGDTDAIWL
ncbi:MAG: nucleotidyltransferase domain-containing protein [Planctomycetota bacterium]